MLRSPSRLSHPRGDVGVTFAPGISGSTILVLDGESDNSPPRYVIGPPVPMPLSWVAIAAIAFYQRFVSPYKGYTCAHRAHAGGASCSGFARTAFRNQGFLAAWNATRRRLAECRVYAAAGPARELAQPGRDGAELGRFDPEKTPQSESNAARNAACATDAACTACTLPFIFS